MKQLVEVLKNFGKVYEYAPDASTWVSQVPFWVIGYSRWTWAPEHLGKDFSTICEIVAIYFYRIDMNKSEMEQINDLVKSIITELTAVDVYLDEENKQYYLRSIDTGIDVSVIREYKIPDKSFRALTFTFTFGAPTFLRY